MGTATVHELNTEQAQQQRDELLAQFGMPLAQVRRLADAGARSADEYQTLRRIEVLAWLLDA